MAQFVNDTFTETSNTDLESHTGETGATWTSHSSYTANTLEVDASVDRLRLKSGKTTSCCYYASGTPTGAEYKIEADYVFGSTLPTSINIGLCGRIDTAANTMYLARWEGATELLELYKIVAGTATLLCSRPWVPTASTTYAFRFELYDDYKRLYIDDIIALTSTDNSITAAGKAGVRDGTITGDQNLTIDNFVATDLVAATTPDAVEFAVINSTLPSNTEGTGTKDFTSSGFGTPTGFIALFSNANTTNNPQSDFKFCYGFSDLMSDCCISTTYEGGSSVTKTRRNHSDEHCIYISNTVGDTQIKAAFDSLVTDGVRINFSTVNTSVNRNVTVVLFKGTVNARALAYQLGTGTGYTISEFGFKPTFVNTLTVGSPTAPPTDAVAGLTSIGFVHDSSGGVDQAQIGVSQVEGISTSNPETVLRSDSCVGQMYSSTQNWKGVASAFTSTGFTLTTDVNPASDYVFMLAIECPDQDDLSIDIIDSPAATGSWSTTAPAIQPSFAMLIQSMCSATNTIESDQDGGAFSIGAFDSTIESSKGCAEQDAVTTMNGESYSSDSNAIYLKKWGGSSFDTMYQGAFTSFDTNGYTFNIATEADTVARKWISVAFKSAAAGGVTELTISDGIFMYDPDSRSLDAIKDEQFQFLDLLNKNHSAFHFENFLLNDFLSKDIAITALDKLLINDIFYKNVSLNLHDDLLLNDEIYKILESIIIDKLLLSDSSLQEIIAQNVISKIVTDYLDLSDSKLTEHDKTIFSSLFLNDFIKTIQDKIILDKLLLSDLSTQEISAAINVITKTVTDYLNLNDEDKKEYNKTIRNNLFLLENFIKLYEKRLDDSLFLYDSYTKAIIGAITEVLVFAKIQSINLLGESIEVEDNYLNVTTDIVSPD